MQRIVSKDVQRIVGKDVQRIILEIQEWTMHNWHLTLTPYPLLVGIAMTAMILEISSS